MAQFNEAWVEHQRRRAMRPDAHRWMRSDAYRYAAKSFERKFDAGSIAHADDPEVDWRNVCAIRAAQCEIAAASVELALERLQQAWCKANFNLNQPRVPAGNPEGGQWTNSGIGHNQRPPLDNPPEIPKQRPATAQEINAFLRTAAKWFARAGSASVAGRAFIAAYEALSWLDTDRRFIETYQDPPKSLRELQEAVSSPGWGYNTHHVVEQGPAARRFLRSMIDAPENLVRIPTLKHWEINRWFSQKNYEEKYQGRSPREYLEDKDWDERMRVGLDALIRHGVLKP